MIEENKYPEDKSATRNEQDVFDQFGQNNQKSKEVVAPKTEIKNAHAAGDGAAERTDLEQTDATDKPAGLEGAEKY